MSLFLITGATGLLGSHIAAALLQGGYPVVALARGKNGLSGEQRVLRLKTLWLLKKMLLDELRSGGQRAKELGFFNILRINCLCRFPSKRPRMAEST